MCPLVLNDWPTETWSDGEVTLKQPFEPAWCRGQYHIAPASSAPQRTADDATYPTSHDCPFDNPRLCPHWAARMDRYGDRYGVPPRSRNATVEELPGDIADGVIAYLSRLKDNVDGGINVILLGPVGAGKTSTAGLILISYGRLTQRDDGTFILADRLFQLLGTPPRERTRTDDELWQEVLRTPLLVIDDLGTELATTQAVRNWNMLIDERHQGRLATIITTNVADFDDIFHDERARSRFMADCQVWRTNRGDMRAVAATSVGAPDGEGLIEPDPVRIEALMGCLPWPRTPEEWEAVAPEIRARPVLNNTEKVHLLADHGIPAVVTYRSSEADAVGAEESLRSLLLLAAGSDRHRNLLEAIAWRSHAFGLEYPAHFLLRDWRERLADVPWSDQARERYGIPAAEAGGHDGGCHSGVCV